MSYLRYGHPLQWFKENSTEYVYGCGDNQIDDYNSDYNHLPSLLEVIGHIVHWETGDFDYATKIVVALAYKLGIKHKLRLADYPYEEMEKSRGNDYREEIKHWMRFFDIFLPARGEPHMKDDDISNFDYLETLKENELYDVKYHFDALLEEIRTAVEGIVKDIELPSPVEIDASVYRWSPVCDDESYELEATIAFKKKFTNDDGDEEREIKKVETRINESGVLDTIGKRIGVKIGLCCYMPFSFSNDENKNNDSAPD